MQFGNGAEMLDVPRRQGTSVPESDGCDQQIEWACLKRLPPQSGLNTAENLRRFGCQGNILEICEELGHTSRSAVP